MTDQTTLALNTSEQTISTETNKSGKSSLGRFLKIGCSVLILLIILVFVFLLLFALGPGSPHKASSIAELKRDVFWITTGDNWDKLEIAKKLENLESVVYIYTPGTLDFGPLVKAEIKFNKNINSDNELKQLFNNALIASGISPLQGYPGGYCFKRSQGYFKTDILYINSNDDFPRKAAFVSVDYGDSWKSCEVQFNL